MGLAITVNTDITCINQTNTRKVHTACANILALPEAPVSGAFLLPEEGCILNKKRTAAIIVAAILGLASLLYLGGVLGQLQENYEIWIASGGITGQAYIQPVNWMPSVCFRKACSIQGIKSIGMLLLVGAAIILYSGRYRALHTFPAPALSLILSGSADSMPSATTGSGFWSSA